MNEEDLDGRRSAVLCRIRGYGRVTVALSGGVDSAVLLLLAVEALGRDRVLAVTAISASLSPEDAEDARKLAKAMGVAHLEVETREIENPAYRANAGDRCYHCRSDLFRRLRDVAEQRGYRHFAYGAIADDETDYRPGMTAAREAGAEAPLLSERITKEDVRAFARQAGLAVAEKPAAACLSSRIPVGTEVTPERLSQIASAESGLRRLGFEMVRVRHHGEIARVELDEAGMEMLRRDEFRTEVVRIVRSAGFRFVTIDLDGYRRGSLNPALSGPASPGPGKAS